MSEQQPFPLVSIIIPCFNHERFILQTLQSILSDNYPNKEICIINDGSTDNSDAIVKTWIEEHQSMIPVRYKYRANRGLCNTMNELVQWSSGPYILPIASDDLIIPGTIGPRVKMLQALKDKAVIIGDCAVISNDNKLLYQSSLTDLFKRDKELYQDDETLIHEVINHFCIAGPSGFMDRRIYDTTGPYPTGGSAEDNYFYQRAASKRLICYWDHTVAKYRVHDDNHFKNPKKQARVISSNIQSLMSNFTWFPGWRNKARCIYEIIRQCYGYTRIMLGLKAS